MRAGIHYANLAKSKRLQAVLALLVETWSAGATTRQIIDATGVCAVNSIISELRKQGRPITCKFEGRTPEGNSVFRYRLSEATP